MVDINKLVRHPVERRLAGQRLFLFIIDQEPQHFNLEQRCDAVNHALEQCCLIAQAAEGLSHR